MIDIIDTSVNNTHPGDVKPIIIILSIKSYHMEHLRPWVNPTMLVIAIPARKIGTADAHPTIENGTQARNTKLRCGVVHSLGKDILIHHLGLSM